MEDLLRISLMFLIVFDDILFSDVKLLYRLGMLHFRMNKSILDLECCMKIVVNPEDDLSLCYFRIVLGLNQISNKAENLKRCGQFEQHD